MCVHFRPYCCPCPGASCKWQGSLEQVMPHLMHQHKSITTLQGKYPITCTYTLQGQYPITCTDTLQSQYPITCTDT